MGKDSSSAHIIQCMRESVVSYSIPNTIISDNDLQFISREFEKFCKRNGIRYIKSSAYHPRSNREIERFVQTFKNCMKQSKYAQKDNSCNSCAISYLIIGSLQLQMRLHLNL